MESGASRASPVCQAWAFGLKIILHAERTWDTSQANAQSVTSRKDWRLDGTITMSAFVSHRGRGYPPERSM